MSQPKNESNISEVGRGRRVGLAADLLDVD